MEDPAVSYVDCVESISPNDDDMKNFKKRLGAKIFRMQMLL